MIQYLQPKTNNANNDVALAKYCGDDHTGRHQEGEILQEYVVPQIQSFMYVSLGAKQGKNGVDIFLLERYPQSKYARGSRSLRKAK